EHALAYAKKRKQFGRPIGGFQMVQDQLVKMLAGVTTSMTLCHRLSQLEEQGQGSEEAASLAKLYCTVSARETVGLARELL
ncbi:acyl-CoA dehydrogenase family protein, partial [Salmonella enterica subsp. enterica serovar 1,4,[5],12:i:-]